MIYAIERLMSIWSEIQELILANKAETDLFGEPLRLDVESLMRLDEDGYLKIFTMRHQGILVGYCSFVLYFHLHHSHMMIANQDVIYIKKGHRLHASRFVRYCDRELKIFGVSMVFQHSPAMNDWGPVLERIGYKELETTYFRRI